MTEIQTGIRVRTGHGTVKSDGTFSDVIGTIERAPRQHNRWQSVMYDGKRYQLMGGVRTDWWINLSMPIKGKTPTTTTFVLHGPQTLENGDTPEWELPEVYRADNRTDVHKHAQGLSLEFVSKPQMLFGGYYRDTEGACYYVHTA
jgi:hypothetical protein